MNALDLKKIVVDWAVVFMRLSMHDFTRHARATGLSMAQMNVLTHLYYHRASGVLNLTELMQVSPAGASQMVERLVQQGLVQRVESPEDRRVRLVHLTESGKKAVAESIAAHQRWMEDLMASLDDAQREAITYALLVLTEKATELEARTIAGDGRAPM